MTEVQELMMDQLNSGDDATTVACRWLQGRQNVWQPWLPDSSKCFPQFGLYKEVTSSFVPL
jgi:ABC-type proline/glycine betaine transport system substrate-binding protein